MMMQVRIKTLRTMVRQAIREQAWVPGRYYPGSEPMSPEDAERINSNLGEDDEVLELELDEVDTDPSNNPGRPDDPYEYLGMHPNPTAAMAPPHAGGSSGLSGAAAPGGVPGTDGAAGAETLPDGSDEAL